MVSVQKRQLSLWNENSLADPHSNLSGPWLFTYVLVSSWSPIHFRGRPSVSAYIHVRIHHLASHESRIPNTWNVFSILYIHGHHRRLFSVFLMLAVAWMFYKNWNRRVVCCCYLKLTKPVPESYIMTPPTKRAPVTLEVCARPILVFALPKF